MIKSIILLLALLISLLSTSGAWATTYYIDWVNGDDTNDGTSKSTPWKRAPGMQGCLITDTNDNPCRARTHASTSGDTIILKGGVTWPKEALSWDWYFGNSTTFAVDQTWYTGASWSRPILDAQGTEPTASPEGVQSIMRAWGTDHIVDNIEFTGAAQLHGGVNGYGAGFLRFGTSAAAGGEIKNCYFHGWSHGGTATSDNSIIVSSAQIGEGPDMNLKVHHNVWDGSDTTGDMAAHYKGSVGHFYNNYVGYMANAFIVSNLGYVWGNTFDHIADSTLNKSCDGYPDGYFSFDCTMHGNTIETYGPQYPIYNNLIQYVGGGATLILYPGESDTTYIFNNVIINDVNQTMQLGAQQSADGYYIFNNTIQCSSTIGVINSGGGTFVQSAIQNNHIISKESGNINVAATTLIVDHNIEQTLVQATSSGYVATGAYPFWPPVNGVTVRAGTNLQSIAAGIPSTIISDAANAVLSDTTCGVEYDATNHRVIGPNKKPKIRGTIWDIGAYQILLPPQNLRIKP